MWIPYCRIRTLYHTILSFVIVCLSKQTRVYSYKRFIISVFFSTVVHLTKNANWFLSKSSSFLFTNECHRQLWKEIKKVNKSPCCLFKKKSWIRPSMTSCWLNDNCISWQETFYFFIPLFQRNYLPLLSTG